MRLEIATVMWMVIEAAVALGAGLTAGSVLLTAFGIDSVIELVSGAVLLWRFRVEERNGDGERIERVEGLATWVVAGALGFLCLYVLISSIYGLAGQSRPQTSPTGIAVAMAAVVVMPALGVGKRRLANQLDSAALRGDAAESFTCAYMAATVLVGLTLNALFGWWWADNVAALVFLVWLGKETIEALGEARGSD